MTLSVRTVIRSGYDYDRNSQEEEHMRIPSRLATVIALFLMAGLIATTAAQCVAPTPQTVVETVVETVVVMETVMVAGTPEVKEVVGLDQPEGYPSTRGQSSSGG